jgi:hypothetical protein
MVVTPMTHDEILTTPAGRQMDALIAEKVMGLSVCMQHSPQSTFHPEYCFDCKKPFPKDYSTDISAAWQIVQDKFHNAMMLNNVHGIWHCYLPHRAEGKSKFAPLAICRAALLSLLEA